MFIFIVIAVRCFKIQLHSPLVLLLSGYIVSLLLSFIGLLSWNTEKTLEATVFFAILASVIGFCVGDILSKKIIRTKKKVRTNYSLSSQVSINNKMLIASLVIFGLTIVAIIFELGRMCNANSCQADSLPGLIYNYRNASSLFSSDATSFSFITSQLIKLCNITTLFYIYCFIKNFFSKDKVKHNWRYLLPLPLFAAICLLQSGRGVLMVYLVATLVFFVVFYTRKHADNMKRAIARLAIGLSGLALVTFILFYAVSPLLGRPARASFVDYTSFYFGCPTPTFNIAVKNNSSANSTFFGENTFRGVYGALDKLHIIDFKKERSLPFIDIRGFHSNVYTSAYRSFTEFGLLMTLLLSLVSGFILGKLHYAATTIGDYRFLIIYALLSASILDMFRDETFYTNIISTATVANIAIIFAVSFLLKTLRNHDGKKAIAD